MAAVYLSMRIIENIIQDIGEFFSRDILSFSILVCLGVFLMNHLASAQSLANSPTTKSILKVNSRKYTDKQSSGRLSQQIKFHNGELAKKWQVNLNLSAAQKAIKEGTQKGQNANEYSLESGYSYQFDNDMGLKTSLGYITYTKNELQNDFTDLITSFYLMKSNLNSNIVFKPYLLSTFPVSKDSRHRQQMNLGLGLGGLLAIQTNFSTGKLTTAASISFQKYSHKYETALNNAINTSHTSNQQISASWEYLKIALSLQFRHINSWNYNETTNEFFFHSQEVSWNLNKNLSFAIGHTNLGSTFAPNKEDIEVRLVDDINSMVYLSTNYVF